MSKMHICNVINHNSISFVSFPYYTGEFGKVSLCRKYLSVFSGWYQIMIPSRESSYNRATLHIGEVVPKMLGQPPKSFLHISAPFQAQCEVLFRIYNVSSISYPPPKMIRHHLMDDEFGLRIILVNFLPTLCHGLPHF